MKKVLIYQNIVPHYRKPIFDKLGQYVDLTLLYSGDTAVQGKHYSIKKLPVYCIPKMGSLHGRGLINACRNADVLISMLALKSPDINHIKLFCPQIKTIGWGIGVPATYSVRFDGEDHAEQYMKAINKCDAALFYSDYPKMKYSAMGIPTEKLFVANNTVEIGVVTKSKKEFFLFVGTLYKQKRVDILLEEYRKAYLHDNSIPNLVIIGDGDERDNIINWIKKESLEEKIILTGSIYDEDKLAEYFAKSYLCISPDQAGLSVLKSMGYGVPYLTHKNAITGGEIFNIKNGENGVIIEDFNEISSIILDVSKNTEKYIQMGEKARSYYQENRTVEHMVQGFIDAIEYVTKN